MKNKKFKLLMSTSFAAVVLFNPATALNVNAADFESSGYDYSDLPEGYNNSRISVYNGGGETFINDLSLGIDAPDTEDGFTGDQTDDTTGNELSNTYGNSDDENGFMNMVPNHEGGYDLYRDGDVDFQVAYVTGPEVREPFKIIMWIDKNGDNKFSSDEGIEQEITPKEQIPGIAVIDFVNVTPSTTFTFNSDEITADNTNIKMLLTTDTSVSVADGDVETYSGYGEVESYSLNMLDAQKTNQQTFDYDDVVYGEGTVTYVGVTEPVTNKKLDVEVSVKDAEILDSLPVQSNINDSLLFATNSTGKDSSGGKAITASTDTTFNINIYEAGTKNSYATDFYLVDLQSAHLRSNGEYSYDYSPSPTDIFLENDSLVTYEQIDANTSVRARSDYDMHAGNIFGYGGSNVSSSLLYEDTSGVTIKPNQDGSFSFQNTLVFAPQQKEQIVQDVVLTSTDVNTSLSNAPLTKDDLLSRANVVATNNENNILNELNVDLGGYDYQHPQVGSYIISLTYTDFNDELHTSKFNLIVTDDVPVTKDDITISASDVEVEQYKAPTNSTELLTLANAKTSEYESINNIAIDELDGYDYQNPQVGTYNITISSTGENLNTVSQTFVLKVIENKTKTEDITGDTNTSKETNIDGETPKADVKVGPSIADTGLVSSISIVVLSALAVLFYKLRNKLFNK